MTDWLTLFGGSEYEWLVDRLVKRVEQGRPLDRGTVSKPHSEEGERRGIDDLLGRRSSSGTRLSVNLGTLARTHPDLNLMAVVQSLRGPIANEKARREAEKAAWEAMLATWRRRLGATPWLVEWLNLLARDGTLRRFAHRNPEEAGRLLSEAEKILRVSDHGGMLLATLAANTTGDSHALDIGKPLGTMCLRGIRSRFGLDGKESASARREAWAEVGVEVDDVSAPVLCLNLRVAPGHPAAGWIDWHCERGEPFFLPWRQIKDFKADPDMAEVHVCENPAVVSEAANRLGADCRPLVCLNGRPNVGAKTLLRAICEAGVLVRIRADFDWAGLRIVDELFDSRRMELWRMDVETYERCRGSQELTGIPLVRDWNRALATMMRSTGTAGYEEEVVEVLLRDLGDLAD